jgi:hypothetical protein
MRITLPEGKATIEEVSAFYRELKERVEALPGVEAFATSFYLPMGGGMNVANDFEIEGSSTTRLALAAVRRHEASIHRAVLIGLVGPDQVLKLPRLTERRLEEIDANGPGTNLAETIKGVLAGLDEPVTVTAFDPLDGKDIEIKASRFALQLATIRALETGCSLALLERSYARMSEGISLLWPGTYSGRAGNGWAG